MFLLEKVLVKNEKSPETSGLSPGALACLSLESEVLCSALGPATRRAKKVPKVSEVDGVHAAIVTGTRGDCKGGI
jgi:hypothetical protein